jgi:hypothetical protein
MADEVEVCMVHFLALPCTTLFGVQKEPLRVSQLQYRAVLFITEA